MPSKPLTLIACVDTRNGIGASNTLPWRLSKEMAYFAKVTSAAPPNMQNAVLMGRTTWDGIPKKFRPLKNRLNIVLSRSDPPEPRDVGVEWVKSLEEAIQLVQCNPAIHRSFIIGGAQLYNVALTHPATDRILLTQITKDGTWECDTFFPRFQEDDAWQKANYSDLKEWLKETDVPEGSQTEKDVEYEYQMWRRRA